MSTPRSPNRRATSTPTYSNGTPPHRPPTGATSGNHTYLPITDETNLHLATMIDCYNRRLAGWPITDHMRTELVQDTLKAAVATHGSPNGTIFHSDHESVYYSKTYTRLRGDSGVIQSMDALGTSADNTLAESFNTTMKREVLQDTACWANETTCRRQLFRWLIHYNTHRPHT